MQKESFRKYKSVFVGVCLCFTIFSPTIIFADDLVQTTDDCFVVTTDINATADEAWKVLIDFENYRFWNKWYFVQGEAKLGATIKAYSVNGKPDEHLDLEITKMEDHTLCWTDVSWFTYFGAGGWRCRTIKANPDDDGIKIMNHFEFTGPFGGILKWYVTSEALLEGMTLENHSLKALLETN